jgi:hypothetical protein
MPLIISHVCRRKCEIALEDLELGTGISKARLYDMIGVEIDG